MLWPLGATMAGVEDVDTRRTLYQVHAALGWLTALGVLVRIVVKWRAPAPAPLEGMSALHARGVKLTHIAIYVVLLLTCLSGTGTVAALQYVPFLRGGPLPEPREEFIPPVAMHGVLPWLLVGLVVAHVVGVLRFERLRGGVLARMRMENPD